MGIKDLLIKIKLRGGKKAEKGIKGVDSAMGGLASKAMKIAGAFYAAKGILTAMNRLVQISSEMKSVGDAFDNLSVKAGFGAEALNKLQTATDGTVSSLDLMTQANNAMLLGIFETEDAMAEMFDVAQRLGAALGKDTLFGVESLVTGMGRQSKLMLDNLGIMIDTVKANEEYAESIGKASSELTDQEKKTAFNIATMKAAKELVAGLGEEQLTTADKIRILKSSATDMAGVIGKSLTPAFHAGLDILTKFSVQVSASIKAISKIDLMKTGKNIINNTEALLTAVNKTFKAYIDFLPDFFRSAFDKILPIAEEVMTKMLEGVKGVAVFIWEPIKISAKVMSAKVLNLFTGMFNKVKEQYNLFADSWAGEKLGLEKLEMSALLDVGLLESELKTTRLVDKLFQLVDQARVDDIQNLKEFTKVQGEIWAEYFDKVAVAAEEPVSAAVESFARRTEGGFRRAQKATKDWGDDLEDLINLLEPSFKKVEVPGLPTGTSELYIDFFTGLNIASENAGEKSQEFWDNLTGGMQNSAENFGSYVQGVSGLFEGLYAHKKQLIDNDMNAEIKSSQKLFQFRKKAIIDSNTVEGKLTEKGQEELQELEMGHDSAINNIKEKFRQKDIEAQRKLKPIRYAQAVSNTAAAIIKALAAVPPPGNFVLAGLVGAAGAAEIATIAAQPFAQGGLVGGVGNIDSVPAILTPGEFVMSKQAVQNIGAQNLADMNQGGGGITLNINAPLVDESVVDHIIPAIEKAQRMNLA